MGQAKANLPNLKTTMSTTHTTSTTETITTSFPLGLFCNATLSSPVQKAKAVGTSSTHRKTSISRKMEQKIENLHPIDQQSREWMKKSDWTVDRPHRKS